MKYRYTKELRSVWQNSPADIKRGGASSVEWKACAICGKAILIPGYTVVHQFQTTYTSVHCSSPLSTSYAFHKEHLPLASHPGFPIRGFTHTPLISVVLQTLFMFCRAAQCPPLGAILPCHFISDSISSALLLLKAREALVASRVCLGIYRCCSRPVAPHFSNLLFEQGSEFSGAACFFLSVLIFMVSPAHTNTMSRNVARTAKQVLETFPNHQHAHTCNHTITCSVKGALHVWEYIRCEANYHHQLNNQLCKRSSQSWFIVRRIH